MLEISYPLKLAIVFRVHLYIIIIVLYINNNNNNNKVDNNELLHTMTIKLS